MIIADLVGKRLEGIDGSLTTLRLIFEGDIALELYPYVKRAGMEPQIAWTIQPQEQRSEAEG